MKKIDIDKSVLIKIMEYAAVVISGCIFVLVSASWTSPLFPQMYGYDSAWYSLMGRAITEGYVPYRDYFDLKGPVFFFIEAIGQSIIKGRNGIFLMECAASAVSSVFIYKTAGLYLKRIQSWIVLILYYFVYVFLLWGGNTCEEYMMAFDYACIYLTAALIKRLKTSETLPDMYGISFFFGISFAIIGLSKITVAVPLIAAALTILWILIKEKKAAILPKMILIFTGGVLTISIPVCMYFVFHGAFKDFIYCVFEFAFKRSTDYYETFSLEWERNLSICYAGVIAGIITVPRDKEGSYRRFFMVVLSVFTWLALHLGTPYTYYFITEIPVFVMILIEGLICINILVPERIKRSGFAGNEGKTPDMIPEDKGTEEISQGSADPGLFTDRKEAAGRIYRLMGMEALVLVILFMYAKPVYDKLSENLVYLRYPDDAYYEGCIDTWDYIPFYEREDVYNLESGMIIYEINRALPANKYPVNLPYFLHLDPVIKQNVLAYLEVKKPKWIISEEMTAFDDEDTREYVFSHYRLVRQTNSHEIYKRVE